MVIQYYADSDVNGNINAFYNDDIWDVTKIPTTAIKITQAQWEDNIANQGKYIIQTGALSLAPPPTQAQKDAKNLALQKQPPTDSQRIASLESALLSMMGL